MPRKTTPVPTAKAVRQRTRGEYRPIYGVLLDDADYQQLSANARLTMLTVKLSLGAAGIGVLYPGSLAARSGLSEEALDAALGELDVGEWTKRERNVLWLVNGLRFEPSMSPDSLTQRRHIQRYVAGLPGLPIIAAFRARYPEWFVGEDTPSTNAQPIAIPSGSPTDSPSHTPSGAYGIGPCGGGGGGGGTSRRPKSGDPAGFSEAWAEYPKRDGGNSRRDAARAFAARLRQGVLAVDLTAGVRRYRAYCEAKGIVGSPYVKSAATFFGPGEHYAEPWTVAVHQPDDDQHVMGPAEYDAYCAEESTRVLAAQAQRDAERAVALP